MSEITWKEIQDLPEEQKARALSRIFLYVSDAQQEGFEVNPETIIDYIKEVKN